MPDLEKVGRVALRQEGQWWVAYYALPGTMTGALTLGRIRLAPAMANPRVKELFIETMRELVADIIESKTGIRPIWKTPEEAPEHEKAGNA